MTPTGTKRLTAAAASFIALGASALCVATIHADGWGAWKNRGTTATCANDSGVTGQAAIDPDGKRTLVAYGPADEQWTTIAQAAPLVNGRYFEVRAKYDDDVPYSWSAQGTTTHDLTKSRCFIGQIPQ